MRITSTAALKSILTYDPATGVFTSIRRRGTTGGKALGQICAKFGYLRIKVFGRLEQAHRLAWLYHYGEPPPGEIDHINGIKTDNRISNLRIVTRAQNLANRGARKDSASGIRGVKPTGRKWESRIKINGKNISLGRFPSMEEAIAAYEAAHKAAYETAWAN